jgi:catechol 2,3-dioxygenase-like lactoylglutathione lyase family enzyme
VTDGDQFTVSHVGICVSDLDRSLRFYCDGLGFVPTDRAELDGTFAGLLEVDKDLPATQQFVRRDGMFVSLMCFARPEPLGRPSSSRRHLGLTFLAFDVPDLDAAVERLVRHGATVVESTRTAMHGFRMVFPADPDGVRIELLEVPATHG